MQVAQLKEILNTVVEFSSAVNGHVEFSSFVTLLPSGGRETTAAFVKRIKSNLKGGSASAPSAFDRQINAVQNLFSALGVKKSVCDDLTIIRTLWSPSFFASMNGFTKELVEARDRVVQIPPRKPTSSAGAKKAPSAKKLVEEYVEKFQKNVLNPAAFELALKQLKAEAGLSDNSIKKIANQLNNFPSRSPLRPKTREDAFYRILGYQHKEAGSESARKALEFTPL